MKWRHCIVLLIVAMLFLTSSVGASAEAVLELPANLEIIEEEAFYGATSIGKVILPAKTREIQAMAFANSSLTEIVIPNSSTLIAETAFDNHIANLVIRGRKGSSAENYALAHSIHFALLETSVVLTQSWEDFAGASSSLVQNYEGAVSVSSEGSAYANGRLIVKTNGDLPDISRFNPEAIVRDPESHYLIQFSDSDIAENCADYLSSASGVIYVEPDQDFSSNDIYIDDFETQSYSWGVTATNADAYAADLRKRNKDTSVVVAVVDTGVDFNHPMLSERLVQGYDFIDNDDTPQDGNRHGTHVSGTIVDCTPGLNVHIMPVRVLGDDGRGAYSAVAQGIRFAARSNANVINMSLGGGHSYYIDEAVEIALQNGVTVVVAAGNESENTDYHCPAHIEECITVAAVNQNMQRAYFSNYGNAVDIAAPGVNINSAVPGGGYASLNGTSMATPHVSAAAAMLICDNPGISPSSVSSMLRNAATDLGESGWDAYFGAGFLNLAPFIQGGPKQYTVSYNANGGSGGPASQIKVEDVTLTLSTKTPSRASSTTNYTVTLNANGGSVSPTTLNAARNTSYSFKSWNTKADGSGDVYNSGSSYTANEDMILYAQWNSSSTTSEVTLPTPTRDGYSFQGWASSANATTGFTGSYTPSGDVTLYAIWKANSYTVTYNANGGTGAPASQTKTHGIDLTLSTAKPTRASSSAGSYTVTLNANGGSVNTTSLNATRTTSYTFKNWNTVANGNGTSYTSGATYSIDDNVTLYAQWDSSTSTASVTLPTPTRNDYTFKGWATSSNSSSGVTGIYTPNSNVTLYATWEANLIASGTWGNLTWRLDTNGLLTISGEGAMNSFSRSSNDAWLAYKDSISNIKFQGGITSIGNCAFYNCSNLTDITIPSGVTRVGQLAYFGCVGLIHFQIPDSVTVIKDSAFMGCTGLRRVFLSDNLTELEGGTFNGCTSLESITIPSSVTRIGSDTFLNCTGLESVVIKDGVTSILDQAFGQCSSLQYLQIPPSVTSIGRGICFGCNSLNTIYFGGTQEQWNTLTSTYNRPDPLLSANVICGVTPF